MVAEKDAIPAKGPTLRWAREQVGLNRREAALFLGVSEHLLSQVEANAIAVPPSLFDQMQSVYHQSESMLLAPEVPETEPAPTNYRTSRSGPAKASTATLLAIRDAQRFQRFMSEILEEDPELIRHADVRRKTLGDDAEATALAERRTWAVAVSTQMRWVTGAPSFHKWRARAMELGILVLLKQMPWEDCRGLALVQAGWVPTIVVNTEDAPAAQIFTIFHEYAHLVLGEAGACVQQSSDSPHGRIEKWCNRFAAAFLVPEPDLRDQIARRFGEQAGPDFTMSHIDKLATTFRVSKHVIARRLSDLGISDFYREYSDELFALDRFVRLPAKPNKVIKRPPAHVLRLREIGSSAAHTILEAVRADIVEVTEAADLLDLSVDQLLDLEERAEVQRRKDVSA
jgi:Zn-dependent peptidase ImmA (M78 family)